MIVKLIRNLTSAQLGHWPSTVIVLEDSNISFLSLYCNSICYIKSRVGTKLLGGGGVVY